MGSHGLEVKEHEERFISQERCKRRCQLLTSDDGDALVDSPAVTQSKINTGKCLSCFQAPSTDHGHGKVSGARLTVLGYCFTKRSNSDLDSMHERSYINTHLIERPSHQHSPTPAYQGTVECHHH